MRWSFPASILLLGFFVFFILYAAFWVIFFRENTDFSGVVSPNARSKGFLQTIFPQSRVFSESFSFFKESTVKESLPPSSYSLHVVPRKQVFNLSCEFAAAATILYHYTNDETFSPKNEEQAEKILVEQVGVSSNPNIGVRMGLSKGEFNADELYTNLNQKFGGIDYYGVHAPPFIDLFAQYELKAAPIYSSSDTVTRLQKAIFSGHLVMAWIKLGYGHPVDIALSYASVPIVRGEHSIVIYGYNPTGLWVMDPAGSAKRHILYNDLISASSYFTMPFLEIYPSTIFDSYTPTFLIDKISGLNRGVLRISVVNSSAVSGSATTLAGIMRDFGYNVVEIKDGPPGEEEGLTLQIKKDKQDFLKLIERDLKLASYKVSSVSSDFVSSSSADVVLTIRQDSFGN